MLKNSLPENTKPKICLEKQHEGSSCGRPLYDNKHCIFHSEDIEGKKKKFSEAFIKEFRRQNKEDKIYDFSGFVFPDSINLRNVKFDKDTIFIDAKFFGEETDFSGTEFLGEDTWFNDAKFYGNKINFIKAKFFGKRLRISSVEFLGTETNFRDTEFSGNFTSFLKTKFHGKNTDFSGAKFSQGTGEISFMGAEFSSENTIFNNIALTGGHIVFREAKFLGKNIYFEDSKYIGEHIDFKEAEFSGETISFNNTRFSGEKTVFNSAKFSGNTNFSLAQFSGTAVFNRAQFSRVASFFAAKFLVGADFCGTKFSGIADFSLAQFSGTADFRAAQFSENAGFNNSYFNNIWGLFDSLKNRGITIIWKGKYKISDFRFKFGEESAERHPVIDRMRKDAWYLADFQEQHPFVYKIWNISSKCGQKISYWIGWSFIFAAFFAIKFYLIYSSFPSLFHFNPAIKSHSIWSFVYYSFVTFTTLGFGDIIPTTDRVQGLIIAEVVLGYIMLGGLISIFANKLARRS